MHSLCRGTLSQPVGMLSTGNSHFYVEEQAIQKGFIAVASAPLVRSSYRAQHLLCQALGEKKKIHT